MLAPTYFSPEDCIRSFADCIRPTAGTISPASASPIRGVFTYTASYFPADTMYVS